MSLQQLRAVFGAASLLALTLAAVGCDERNTFVKPPPPKVEVVNAVVGKVSVPKESPGRTRAFARAEIRARVQGFLKKPEFDPGKYVKKGQVLYNIEPEEFEAAVTAANGELEAAVAGLGIAQTNYEKRENASKDGAVSKIDVASAMAERDAAKAKVSIATANRDDADRALTYAVLKSPIDGRVSQTLVDEGNLVGADGPTLLTTVIQDNPIYVDFEGNEREILKFLSKRPDADQEGYDEEFKAIVVGLTLSDGSNYPIKGNLDFIDNQIDQNTGTMKARAVFDNPDGALAAGMFVRISIDEDIDNAIQVPEVAIQRDLSGPYVVVVGADNVVERRPVEETKHKIGDSAVLTSGLTAEDRVIVTNLQRARPGVTVNVVESGSEVDDSADQADVANPQQPVPASSDKSPTEAKSAAKP
jgi:RND family efflux transporter MFP subunit